MAGRLSRGRAPARSRPSGPSASARRAGGRALGVVIGAAGLLVLAAVAWQWFVVTVQREAVDEALEDVPGLGPDVAPTLPASVPPPADGQSAQVVRVVDGDTLVVTGEAGPVLAAAGETTVRLLVIDSPEVDGPSTDEQCYGSEASAFTSSLLPPGSTVTLAPDAELLDRFGRTLAYAWTADGTFVNEAVLRNGYGYAALVPPNDRHISVMTAAEDAARADRLGLWGTC